MYFKTSSSSLFGSIQIQNQNQIEPAHRKIILHLSLVFHEYLYFFLGFQIVSTLRKAQPNMVAL